MKGHFYKPNCACPGKKTKKCSCGATWSYIVDVGINPQTGKRKQKKKGGFATKGDAERAIAVLIVEVTDGTYSEEKNATFKEFTETWLELYSKSGKIKISTIRIKKHEISRLMPYFEYAKMKDITRKQYQNALDDLKTTGYTIKEEDGEINKSYADSTLIGIHRTGRLIFKKAVELSIIKKDPTEYAQIPKLQKTVEEVESEKEVVSHLEKEELALFLDTARYKGLERDYEIFKTLSYTGMRAGELCALKNTDIDFVEHRISITKTYYNPTNNIKEYYLLPPKTKTSIRFIEIDEELINDLIKLRELQYEKRKEYGARYHDKDFVFAKTENVNPGYPEYIKMIENRMQRLLRIAGLNTDLTPHSLRHTHVSLLAEAGVSLQDIMDRLGHKDDDTTKNVYLHVTKTKKKDASMKFSELMKNV